MSVVGVFHSILQTQNVYYFTSVPPPVERVPVYQSQVQSDTLVHFGQERWVIRYLLVLSRSLVVPLEGDYSTGSRTVLSQIFQMTQYEVKIYLYPSVLMVPLVPFFFSSFLPILPSPNTFRHQSSLHLFIELHSSSFHITPTQTSCQIIKTEYLIVV